jgi:hypothetical protein
MGRQLISLLFGTLSVLMILMGLGNPDQMIPLAAGGEPPATLTLFPTAAQRPILSIQPGFTLFIIFPTPIEFVAVGDEGLLAVAVRAPSGVVALKATQRTGRTNIHIQSGGIVTVFEARITPGGRTADIVRVVLDGLGNPTNQRLPGASTPLTGASPAPGSATSPAANPASVDGSPAPTPGQTAPPRPEGVFRVYEIFEQGIRAVFHAYRTANGIEIRYEVSNVSANRWKVALRRILVRADGRIIAARVFGSSDAGSSEILGEGETRRGRLVVTQRADTIEVLFPLFPVGLDLSRFPVELNVRFNGLGSLVEMSPDAGPIAAYPYPQNRTPASWTLITILAWAASWNS